MKSTHQGYLRAFRVTLLAGVVVFSIACNQIKTEDTTEQLDLLRALQDSSQAGNEADRQLIAQLGEISERQEQLEGLVIDLKRQIDSEKSKAASLAKTAQKQPSGESKSASVEPAEDRALRGKSILGRVEWMWLPAASRYFAAQLDTAIEPSLIFAESITSFEREGKPWVRFTVERSGKASEIESRILRSDKFSYPGSRASSKGPVVSLPAELSNYSDAIEFLILPSKKSYPQFVLGRSFLTDVAVVDVSRKYVFSRDPGKLKAEAAKLAESQMDANSKSKVSARNRDDNK